MKALHFAIIGAGSSYTPELLEKIGELRNTLPVSQICLMDIDPQRLEIMEGFSRRFMEQIRYDVAISSTLDRAEAIQGVDFVVTQIRVGLNAARVLDEKIPLQFGLIGQETTGAGGFAKALRTVPAMLEIARDVERYNPDAWIINYTNPTGIVAEAVTRYTRARIAGLCAGGLHPAHLVSHVLGVEPERVKYDYFGLNHFNFSYNLMIDGRPLTNEEFARLADVSGGLDKEIILTQRLIPSSYCGYYYHTSRVLKKLKDSPQTRGEVVQAIEADLFKLYADPAVCTKPDLLNLRGGGGYSDLALSVINAIANNQDTWTVVNVPNNGIVRFLPDDAVIETACLVNRSGIKPLAIGKIPEPVWGIVSMVKNYEMLAVEAAAEGSREKALLALLSHPLIRDYDLAKPLLNELLEANRHWLPQFFDNES